MIRERPARRRLGLPFERAPPFDELASDVGSRQIRLTRRSTGENERHRVSSRPRPIVGEAGRRRRLTERGTRVVTNRLAVDAKMRRPSRRLSMRLPFFTMRSSPAANCSAPYDFVRRSTPFGHPAGTLQPRPRHRRRHAKRGIDTRHAGWTDGSRRVNIRSLSSRRLASSGEVDPLLLPAQREHHHRPTVRRRAPTERRGGIRSPLSARMASDWITWSTRQAHASPSRSR